MFENEIYYFLIALSLLLLILLVLFIYMIARKAMENYRRRQIDLFKEKSREPIFDYIYKNKLTRTLIPDNSIKFQAIEDLLNGYAKVLSGEVAERNITNFANKYFLEQYKTNITSRRWSQRMNTLYMIEDFKMVSLEKDVLKLYRKKNLTKTEESQILKILACFDYPDLFQLLTNTKNDLSEFTYRSIFNKASLTTIEFFIAKYHWLPLHLQLPLIDIIGVKNLIHKGTFLEELVLSTKVQEVKIRSLKAIADIGHSVGAEFVEPFLHSSHWAFRMMGARICGFLRQESLIASLKELLLDKNFSVRSQAARSIILYPNGKKILAEIIETTEDSYAREMAIDWLERGTVYDFR